MYYRGGVGSFSQHWLGLPSRPASFTQTKACGAETIGNSERLAEYGWRPHRDFLDRKNLQRASTYWYMREKQRGTVSSNSRFQMVLVQQYSANLSNRCITSYYRHRCSCPRSGDCRRASRATVMETDHNNMEDNMENTRAGEAFALKETPLCFLPTQLLLCSEQYGGPGRRRGH